MWIAGAIALAAALTEGYQQQQVAKKQNNQIMQGLQEQSQDEARARAALSKNLQNFSPAQGQNTVKQQQGDYLKQVQSAMGNGAGPYQADSALPESVALSNQRAQATSAKDNALADLYGTIGGSQIQRQNENFGTAQTGAYLNDLAGQSQRQMNSRELMAQSIHANPWMSMALKAAESYGMGAMAGGGMFGAAAGAGTGTDSMTGLWNGMNVPAGFSGFGQG